MTCILVDDDPMQLAHLDRLCSQVPQLDVIKSFPDGLAALEYLKSEEGGLIDMVFLDIEMPDLSGMDLMRTMEDMPPVVFTTSKEEYAIEAFEQNVVDYLVKPVALPRLLKAVDHVEKLISGTAEEGLSDDIFVRSEGSIVRIHIDELMYVETMGDYVVFNTVGGEKHIVHSTLKSMAAKLKHPSLLKVHRSFIVNLTKVVDIEETNMVVGKKLIPISRAHKPILLKKIRPL